VISERTPLILGSASPRRREILSGLRIPLRVVVASVLEEVAPAEAPADYLQRIVTDKLCAVLKSVASAPVHAVLVADTIVVIDETIVNKPEDVVDAERLLTRLVGRTHTVYTRYAIATTADFGAQHARTVASAVTMRPASAEEITRYARTGEGLDKAGAYAVQGIGSFLVERIEGSYTNVVGLPACEVVVDLRRMGLLGLFP
jgi:septum formation protein